MAFDIFAADGLERSQSHPQGDFANINAPRAQAVANRRREVQTGGWSGHGAAPAGKNRLVAFAVRGFIRAGDVGRERNVAQALDGGQQVFTSGETKLPQAVFAAANHLGLQLSFTKDDALSGADLAAWAHQRLPDIPRHLPG